MTSTIEICLFYASEDEKLKLALEKQLKALQRQNLLIALWHSHNISPGVEWAKEIERHINTAHIILLLLSADFLASDDLYSRLVKPAMERHERGEVLVIPVVLRPVSWEDALLSKLQALPESGKPVTDNSWHSLDEALFDIVVSIRRVVEKLTTKTLPPELIASQNLIAPRETTDLHIRNATDYVLAQTLIDHLGPIACLTFLDDKTLVSDGWDHTIKFWYLPTGHVDRTIRVSSSQVYSIAVENNRLICGCEDGSLLIWDIEHEQLINVLTGHTAPVASVAFILTGILISGSDDNTVKVWDLQTNSELRTITQHEGPVASIAVKDIGDTFSIASGGYDRTIIVQKLRKTHRHSFPPIKNAHTGVISTLAYHPRRIDNLMKMGSYSRLAQVRDNIFLASGSHDGTIKLWNTLTGQLIKIFTGHTGPISGIAFSPHGHILVSGSHDKTVKLWDVDTGALLTTLKGHTEAVLCVAFHPREDMIISGSLDKTIKIWRLKGSLKPSGEVDAL